MSVQPLHVYGALVRHFRSLGREERDAALTSPELEDYRHWVRGQLPDIHGPFMDLQSRVSMRRIVAQTLPEEENALCIVLLEYFVTQLEPYLQACELDPDQARYLKPICSRLQLTDRPTNTLLDAMRSGRQSSHPIQARVHVHNRRR